MKRTKKPAGMSANEGTEAVPPGATARAADRTQNPGRNPGRGPAGSGAGSRHAANDPGSPDESYEATDTNDPLAEPLPDVATPMEQGPPFAGPSGGAVGGTPAEGRAAGGHMPPDIAPDPSHPGDSTIGTHPT